MSRLLAIGDVHGCTQQLDALIETIRPTADDTVVFLGDYVDRGPDSKGVIDRLIAWKQTFKPICLRGNHELMMQRSRTSLSERRMWLAVGGSDCLASYSAVMGRMGRVDDVPAEHWDFLDRDLVDLYESDRTIFVHAGLSNDHPLKEQPEEVAFWDPLERAIGHSSGKTVIVGHTSQRSGAIWDLGDTICIDTFAHGGGNLTCLDVSTWHYWQANLIGRISEGDLPKR